MAGSFQAADAALNALGPGNVPGVRQAAVALGMRRVLTRLTADVSATSSTTLASVSELAFTVEAGRRYKFRYHLPCTANAAGGNKVDLAGGSATVTSIETHAILTAASAIATVRGTALNTSIAATAANTAIILEGVLLASNTGTVTLQHAQNASNAAASTLYAGGTLEVEDITT